jgi:uncharacterized membrane protein
VDDLMTQGAGTMHGKLQNLWDDIRASLWFIPSVMVLGAFVLSTILIRIDRVLEVRESIFIFGGTGDAARTVLSTIAGSLITVISIAFSITIIALQQASAQFTPRVMRTFTADRSNQFVLGMYTGTFVYALLVLRVVRSEAEGFTDRFVPGLSIIIALILAVICLGLLIYFIHHMSLSLQVSVILDRVRNELIEQIDELYPSQIGEAKDDLPAANDVVERIQRSDKRVVVHSEQVGFLRRVDEEGLQNIRFDGIKAVWIRPQVGDFVTHGGILAEVDRVDGDVDEIESTIRDAFIIDRLRSMVQDPLFGIRQLVDIALKALSPSVNDPTTAEYVLSHLGDALGRLAEREFPPNVRLVNEGRTYIVVNRPQWADFVDAAFSQIRRQARDDVHVTRYLLRVLQDLGLRVNADRAPAIRHQVEEIRNGIDSQSFSEADKADLHRHADLVVRTLLDGTSKRSGIMSANHISEFARQIN